MRTKNPILQCVSSFILVALLSSSQAVSAQSQRDSFLDVPSNHPSYDAIEYLHSKGIIDGYDNGTFRPNNLVNRAEALKIIVSPLSSEKDLDDLSKTVFTDVPAGSWFLPYVEWAYGKGIVQGPPKTTKFRPDQSITKMEFLKILFEANNVKIDSYGEIELPLSHDTQNVDEWFYPYLRYAISSSVTMVTKEGLLNPNKKLTRSDIAEFLYRYTLYKEGLRTQILLTEVESEIEIMTYNLEKQDVLRAEFASARAILASRGALTSEPKEPLVKAVVKLAEGYRALVRAYRAGIKEDFDTVIKLCGDAWFLAEEGKKIHPSLAPLKQLQADAKELADSARVLKK